MPRVVNLPPDAPLLADGSKLGGWWHTVDDNEDRLVCTLCPRECSLKPGDRGFCFVRENRDGQMVLSTYGRSTGFCIDPIEKKPLNHFLPGTSVLSFGTAGCNLACKFCQNWSISKSREVERLSETAGPGAIARAALDYGCRSVAYTYNDPIIWAEYAMDVARACRETGIQSVAVTAGYVSPAAREPFFHAMDAANVDLKSFTEEFYQKLTLSHLQPVLDTLAWLKHESDVWFEVTNLVIPNANDSDDELRRLCDWMLEHVGDRVPIHFTAFHPDFRLQDRDGTPHETLLRGYEIARATGLKHVYVGNVQDLRHQSTYCPNCQQVLIHRDWYELGQYHLVGNQCKFCNTVIEGRFDESPGNWGRRRLPVRIADFVSGTSAMQTATDSRPELEPSTQTKTSLSNISTQMISPREDPNVSTGNMPTEQPAPLMIADEQKTAIHKAASELVACAVHNYRPEASDPTLCGASTEVVSGCFVTLKRNGRLRGCCGNLGRVSPLLPALTQSATATATRDPRMPAISPIELEHLTLEVSLLHTITEITATGADRAKEVEVGRHGLQLATQEHRGLLLPSVAVENEWDNEKFLRQVCLKAGLPATFWKNKEVQLWTFESTSFGGPFPTDVVERFGTSRQSMFSQADVDHLAEFCRFNVSSLMAGGTPAFYTQGCPDGTVEGLALSLGLPDKERPARFGQVSMQPGFQLQPAALELCKVAAGMLKAAGYQAGNLGGLKIDMAVLTDPAMHGTLEKPALVGFDANTRALMVSVGGRSAWTFDPKKSTEDLIRETAEAAHARTPAAATISSFAIATSAQPMTLVNAPNPQAGPALRAPAVAGAFYPSDEGELATELRELFPKEKCKKRSWRAAMIPHAGWKYSGKIAAEVLHQLEIPDTVIVISPKHTRLGVDWAVAPHQTWGLPGSEVASDPDLAQQLAAAIDNLELDGAAHVREHGIEVELPLIAHLNPNAKVVGIALGGHADLDQCQAFAKSLAEVLKNRAGETLLVISSDMNHYANDEETRQLDEMAMSALESLNPADVLNVVRDNQITMCGVIPAVISLEALQQIEPLKSCERVAYATSGDTTGEKERVVGYAGMLFE